MPAILKILVVFAAMLALPRLRLPLGAALVAGGVALNVWAGLPPADIAANLGRALAGAELWLILAVTVLIVEVGRYVSEGRQAEDLLAAVQSWGGRHGRTLSLVAMPAAIGLIPMAAGALLSAPFVRQTTADVEAHDDWRAVVNYWFRHIWEHWWPLYPGVIIAMALFELDAWRFVAAQIGFTPAAMLAGLGFLVWPQRAAFAAPALAAGGRPGRALAVAAPMLAAVAGLLVLPAPLARLWPALGPQNGKLLGLLAGLAGGILLIVREEGWRGAGAAAGGGALRGRGRLFSTLSSPESRNVLSSLAGVLIFKALLQRSGLLPVASRELLVSGIPPAAAVAALPMLAGFVTGIALGFTGTSFPLVVGLLHAEGATLTPLATLVLAYGFGHSGMMLSPVHLCLLVSRDYFRANLLGMYRRLLPCVLTMLLFTLAAHAVLRALGW